MARAHDCSTYQQQRNQGFEVHSSTAWLSLIGFLSSLLEWDLDWRPELRIHSIHSSPSHALSPPKCVASSADTLGNKSDVDYNKLHAGGGLKGIQMLEKRCRCYLRFTQDCYPDRRISTWRFRTYNCIMPMVGNFEKLRGRHIQMSDSSSRTWQKEVLVCYSALNSAGKG